MNEINTKEIKRRGKGLLALVLTFMLMFGSSLTVLAANYTLGGGSNNLEVGTKVVSGDTITYTESSGGLTVCVGDVELATAIKGAYTVQGDYTVTEIQDLDTLGYKVYLVSNASNGSTSGEKEGSGCAHDYQWVVVTEPTIDAEGLKLYVCANCGEVNGKQIIPIGNYFVKEMINTINAAPDNSTVEIEFPLYNCLTEKILEALEARETVSLKITFEDRTDPDNVVTRSFTIPAGQVNKAYNENLVNGFLYYGSVYGWN